MPVRHYLTLFAMAFAICAVLLALAFEERLQAVDQPDSSMMADLTGTDTLAGTWDTNWGPMTIVVNSTSRDGQVENVTGSWSQSGNTGYITSGTYNRQVGVFRFQFNEPWHSRTGSACFSLGPDDVFNGTWQFTRGGGGGTWSMQRPNATATANQLNVSPPDCPVPSMPPAAPAPGF